MLFTEYGGIMNKTWKSEHIMGYSEKNVTDLDTQVFTLGRFLSQYVNMEEYYIIGSLDSIRTAGKINLHG